jgi:hypothetical protein
MKENVKDLALGIEFITEVQPRTFDWKDTGDHSAGFIAQEIDEVVQSHSAEYLNLVNKNDPENYSIAVTNLIPVLVKAIQELSVKNDALEARIAQLEANG